MCVYCLEVKINVNHGFFRVCQTEKISSALLYQSLADREVLQLVGIGATDAARQILQQAIVPQYPSYQIFTKNIKHRSEHFKHYTGSKKSFNVIRELWREHTGQYEQVKTATCELILKGENITNRHAPYTAYYAYVSAHFVLEQSECENLLKRDILEIQVIDKHKEVTSRAINTKYYLQSQSPNKWLTLKPAPLWWNYRHFKRNFAEEKEPSHFSSFLNDSALLEIDPYELNMAHNKQKVIQKSALEDAMKNHEDNSILDVVFPLRKPKDLELMVEKKVRVKVGKYSGYMVPAEIALEPDARPLLHHIQFVLEDG